MIVRESYYPNWRAHGASGPYRATPNFMVVVPTSKDVSLTFDRSGVEWFGIMLTVLGLLGLGAIGWRWPALARWGDPHPAEVEDLEAIEAAGRRGDPADPGPADDVEALARDLAATGHPEVADGIRAARRGPRDEAVARLGPALRSVLAIEGLDPAIRARAASLLAVVGEDGPGGGGE